MGSIAPGEGAGTDDELSDLLAAIRRHLLEVPPGTWSSEVQAAAKQLAAAIAARL